MSDTFEIKSDDIDVQEIMEKIRENIRKKKEQGAYNTEDEKLVRSIDACGEERLPGSQPELDELEKKAGIDNSGYSISSHRKIIGPTLVRGRQIINGEVRRYVDPVVLRQGEFNASLVDYLRSLDSRLSRLETVTGREMDSMKDELNRELAGVSGQLEREVSDRLRHAEAGLADSLKRIGAEADRDLNSKRWLANALDKKIDTGANIAGDADTPASGQLSLDYLAFENRFRGTGEEIKDRQRESFFGHFRGCRSVLDIGCGRGEFLEILKENGVAGRGVDSDENMVNLCRSKGLVVTQSDAIEYLSGIEDGSLDGIFIDQVIEHLEPGYLVRMLMLCYRKLAPGSCLVAETVNPVSFASLANFYIDMTHKRPVHPETLKFLMEYCGFREIALRFTSPFPEGSTLEKIAIDPGADEKERRISELYNKNIDRLNTLLLGAQDYAAIGKK